MSAPAEPENELLEEGDDDELAPIEAEILPSEAGLRLDKVLAEKDLGPSRNALQRWLSEGRITQDGAVADRKTKARAHSRVRIRPAPPPAYDAVPEAIPLVILFEDAHLLVIDKPAGMVVHPAPGHSRGTLVNALLHHTHLEGGEAVRPGIVHRLDKDTSGVMVVAKTPETHEKLVAMFQAHDLERIYRAICVGTPPDAITYDTFHHRHPTDRKRFTCRVAYGRRAVTHVRTLARGRGVSLVACRLETGRTHQIRVHLAEHGFPLLGDPVYGGSVADPLVRKVGAELGRQALHAGVLGFRHPITGEPLRFETPPPADFERAWAAVSGA